VAFWRDEYDHICVFSTCEFTERVDKGLYEEDTTGQWSTELINALIMAFKKNHYDRPPKWFKNLDVH